MSGRLLNAKEVADLLSVPESWVREATRAERIPYLALGRYRRYSREAIEVWLAGQRAVPSAGDWTDGRFRACHVCHGYKSPVSAPLGARVALRRPTRSCVADPLPRRVRAPCA